MYREVKIEVYVPEEYIEKLREELNKANACRIGNYDNCVAVINVRGYWRPLEGSRPFLGQVGEMCQAHECKVEVKCRREYVKSAIKAIKSIHPYDEPSFNIMPLINDMFE